MRASDGADVRRITFTPGFDGRCDWQRICTITGSGDVICGSPGPDRTTGGGGNDHISGFGGDDQLFGDGGNDNDSVSGGRDRDFVSAGPGDDRVVADAGERVDPGAGVDRCSIGSVGACPPRLS